MEENQKETESTLSELQVCTDASLVCASTPESFNGMDNKNILSSGYIGEGKHDLEAQVYDGAEIGKTERVPIVAADGIPLMPCTAAKAKRLLKSGKAAYSWNKLGMFFLKLNYVPREINIQPLVLGIDTGSKFEGYSISGTQDNLANLMVETKGWIKKAVEVRRNMRRARRFRNTRRRKSKPNRMKGKRIAPSTRARAEARVEIARQLGKIIPFKTVVVEDVKAATRKGKSKRTRRWNANFSPLEVGKQHMYSKLRGLGYEVKLISGFETKAIRDKIGIKKSSDKSKPVFETHCLDAWAIASTVSKATRPSCRKITYLVPLHFNRRQLHMLQFEKGGKRRRQGGTLSNGIKKGTLVNDSKYGLCYVGGAGSKGISLHSYKTGKRLTQKGEIRNKKRNVAYRNMSAIPPIAKDHGLPCRLNR